MRSVSALVLGLVLLAFGLNTSYISAQTSQSTSDEHWRVKYVGGSQSLDPGTDLTAAVRDGTIIFETQHEAAFTIPSARILALVHTIQTVHPTSEALGGVAATGLNSSNGSDVVGGMFFGLLAAATSGIKKDELVLGVQWEDSDIRNAAVLVLNKSAGESFLNELRDLAGKEPFRLGKDAATLRDMQVALDKWSVSGHIITDPPKESFPEYIARSALLETSRPPLTLEVEAEKLFDKVRMTYVTPMLYSDEEHAYVVTNRRVVATDNRSHSLVTKEFNELPCHKRDPFFTYWQSLPNQGEILVQHCGAVYLIDKSTLAVKKRVLQIDPSWDLHLGGRLQISPKGGIAAVVIPTQRQPPMQMVVIDTNSGEISARWPLTNFSQMAFNIDGSLLSVAARRDDGTCGIRVHHMPAGEIHAEFTEQQEKPSLALCGAVRMVPVSGHRDLMAGLEPELMIWDIATGEIVQRLPPESPNVIVDMESAGKGLKITRRWTPESTVFHEPLGVEVLYDRGKEYPGILHHLSDPPYVSSDGRYLLTVTSGGWNFRYTLYRLVPR